MEALARGVEVLERKSREPLLTRFLFYEEVDPAHPLFLQFLRAAGEGTEEVGLTLKDSPHSPHLLRQVLQELPNLEKIDISWGLSLETPLYPHPLPRPTLSLKYLTFDMAEGGKFESVLRDLLESSPLLRRFDTSHQIQIQKWFFATAVLDPTFPTLTHFREFNRGLRLKYRDADLQALTHRRFPLTAIFLNCSEPNGVSPEVLEGFLRSISGTLKKLYLTFSPENAAELMECVKVCGGGLEMLDVKEFSVPLNFLAENFPRLRVLEIRSFKHERLMAYTPRAVVGGRVRRHGLERLTLRQCNSESEIPPSFEPFVRSLFPEIRVLKIYSSMLASLNLR
jgi:hypothetical protein